MVFLLKYVICSRGKGKMGNKQRKIIITILIFLLLNFLAVGCTDEMIEDIKEELGEEAAKEYEKLKEEISRSAEDKYEEIKEGAQEDVSRFIDDIKEWISGIIDKPDEPDTIDIPEEIVEDDCPFPLPDHISEENVKAAIEWAKGFNNITYKRNEGYYYGCLRFAQHAYLNGAGLVIQTGYGNAQNASIILEASRNANNVPPPPGAWIFYSVKNDPNGHAALSLGDGNMIHVNTDDREGTAKVKTNHYRDKALEDYGIVYIGWAWPSVVE